MNCPLLLVFSLHWSLVWPWPVCKPLWRYHSLKSKRHCQPLQTCNSPRTSTAHRTQFCLLGCPEGCQQKRSLSCSPWLVYPFGLLVSRGLVDPADQRTLKIKCYLRWWLSLVSIGHLHGAEMSPAGPKTQTHVTHQRRTFHYAWGCPSCRVVLKGTL